MKKLIALVGLLMIPALFLSQKVRADGNYSPALVVNTTTQQGYLYPASTSSGPVGGVLVSNGGGIFNWSNQTTTSTVSTPGLQIYTAAQLLALTPATTGQIAVCSDCNIKFALVVSTGSTLPYQWILSTGTAAK